MATANPFLYNFVRSAANVETIQVNSARPTQGADQRGLMEEKLSVFDREILHAFHEPNDEARNGQHVYLCLRVEPCKNQEKCAETDQPPIVSVQEIVGLDRADADSSFLLPLLPVQNKEWNETYPRFNNWLLSKIRYPKRVVKTLIPSGETCALNQVDECAVYFAAMVGTLRTYLKTGDSQHVWHLLALILSLDHLLHGLLSRASSIPATSSIPVSSPPVVQKDAPQSKQENNPKEEPSAEGEQKKVPALNSADGELEKMLCGRSVDLEAARGYKRRLDALTAREFYQSVWKLALNRSEAVHRAHLFSLSDTILGLLTLNEADLGSGWEECGLEILRMSLERSMRHVESLNEVDGCVKKEEMVCLLIERRGPQVMFNLSESAALFLFVRIFKSTNWRNGAASIRELASKLKMLRTAILEATALPAIAMICAPGTQVSPEFLAAYLLASGRADKTQPARFLFSDSQHAPLLDRELKANLERVTKTHAALALRLSLSSAPAADSSSSSSSSEKEAKERKQDKKGEEDHQNKKGEDGKEGEEIWKRFGMSAAVWQPEAQLNSKKLIIDLAYRGDEAALTQLRALRQYYAKTTNFVGPKRFRRLMMAGARPHTAVHEAVYRYFHRGPDDCLPFRLAGQIWNRQKWAKYARDLHVDQKEVAQQLKEQPTDPDEFEGKGSVTLEPFESSIKRAYEAMRIYSAEESCCICLVNGTKRHLFTLHAGVRHPCCVPCFQSWKAANSGPNDKLRCPLCRADVRPAP